ncbi:MAG: PRTRC system ParB family protein [Aquabacterium sp.]|nr:PRTRC system ParB family protein [Aquabacterium sp.]
MDVIDQTAAQGAPSAAGLDGAGPRHYVMEVPIDDVVVGPYNPRFGAPLGDLSELAGMIAAQGVLQAPKARAIVRDGRVMYEIPYARRRLAAAKQAGLSTFPIELREFDDEEAVAMAMMENFGREAMTPAQEARAAARMLAEFNGDRAATAKRMGWSAATLDGRLKLMACSPKVLDALDANRIVLGIGELLAGLTKAKQDELLDALLAHKSMPSVEQFKAQVMTLTKNLGAAIFDTAECGSCVHNSAQQRAMFGSLDDGHCLNANCYDHKVDAVLQERTLELKETFPMVRIARHGENFTVRRLVALGEGAVGETQAEACRSCANFGAAISALPDKLGKVSKNLCFSPPCNDEKIAAYRQEQAAAKAQTAAGKTAHAAARPAAAAANPGQTSDKHAATQPTTPTGKAKATSVSKNAPTVVLSAAVVEYRDALYRRTIGKEVLKAPERGLALLLALGAAHQMRAIDQAQAIAMLDKFAADDGKKLASTATLVERYTQAMTCDTEVLRRCAARIAAGSVVNLERRDLVALVKALQPDWQEHYTLDAEFLGKLTKVEIMAVADELGITAQLGDKAKGLSNKKRDEIIAAVLAVEGFGYAGAIPRVLRPEAEQGGAR